MEPIIIEPVTPFDSRLKPEKPQDEHIHYRHADKEPEEAAHGIPRMSHQSSERIAITMKNATRKYRQTISLTMDVSYGS